MIEKGNESKELAGQNQQEQIEEMSASEDVRDEMKLEIEDKLKEYDTPFEVFFNILGKIAIAVVIISMMLFCFSLIKERVTLKNQIFEMQAVIDDQEALLSADYRVVDFDSICDSESDDFMKLLMGEMKNTQVYFENRIYSLAVQQLNEENIIRFYQNQLETIENEDTKAMLQELLDNHKKMSEDLQDDITETQSLLEEFYEVMDIIESGEMIPEEELEEFFQTEQELEIL